MEKLQFSTSDFVERLLETRTDLRIPEISAGSLLPLSLHDNVCVLLSAIILLQLWSLFLVVDMLWVIEIFSTAPWQILDLSVNLVLSA